MATTVTLKPNAIDLSGSTSGTTTLQATAVAGTTTITLPAATDTLVGKATTDTLTNKTLTSPTLTTPVLGTPASGTLTNCTGLPNAGLVNSSITIGGTAIALGASSSTITNDLSISGLTVGKGGGTVSTNTAVGKNALSANTTGSDNVAIGDSSQLGTTTGIRNVSVGSGTLYANTTGQNNVAIGSPEVTGGYSSLRFNTTGSYNTALGSGSLGSNTTGSNNTALGYQALYTTAGGTNKLTAVGYQAGYSNSSGQESVFVGETAGYSTTGGDNTFIGRGAGTSVTSGYANTIIGKYSGNQGGLDIRTANNYIVLSDGGGNPRGLFDGSGNFLVSTVNTTKTNTGFRVESGVPNTSRASTGSFFEFYDATSGSRVGYISNSGGVATLYNTTSDQRLKENIVDAPEFGSVIDSIKVRSFDWKLNQTHQRAGFIAQELVTVAPEAVNQPIDSEEMMAVDYSKLVPMLVKEIQSLRKRLATLEAR